jgi:hypothetical protein
MSAHVTGRSQPTTGHPTTGQPTTGLSRPVLVRAGEAEHLESIGHILLADSSATHGALSSHRDSSAEALIIITPGVERFDYFRHVARWRAGAEPRETLLAMQDRFDTHFTDSAAWNSARTSA